MRTGELPPRPRWHTASAQGPRSVNADAVGAYADPDTHEVVFALADGVGDGADAARAARVAAGAAARTPASHGPAAALLAAQRAVAELDSGDCVMVVAMPCDGGYRIGWVGDTRAYAWTGDDLVQLTTDHTLAEYFRSRGQAVTPRMEHVVTTSVRTARVDEFGAANLTGDAGLLLTSDGVHKRLTEATIQEILAQPDRAAAALVETAIALGGTDNTTAIVVEPHFREAPTTTLTIPMAA
jgi:serine/threonine protein phosphatase PrpC